MFARLTNYFTSSIEELKKVAWPTRKQAWYGTLLVVSLSALLAIYLGVLDFGLNKGVERLIR